MYIKQVTVFETGDGRQFNDIDSARIHNMRKEFAGLCNDAYFMSSRGPVDPDECLDFIMDNFDQIVHIVTYIRSLDPKK